MTRRDERKRLAKILSLGKKSLPNYHLDSLYRDYTSVHPQLTSNIWLNKKYIQYVCALKFFVALATLQVNNACHQFA